MRFLISALSVCQYGKNLKKYNKIGIEFFSQRWDEYFVSSPESKIHPNCAHKSVQLALAPLQP